jgi:hypothetical protein
LIVHRLALALRCGLRLARTLVGSTAQDEQVPKAEELPVVKPAAPPPLVPADDPLSETPNAIRWPSNSQPLRLAPLSPASGPEAYSVLASRSPTPALARHHTSARHERKHAFTQRDHFSTCLSRYICRARHIDVLLCR